jgi:hypothetical protein
MRYFAYGSALDAAHVTAWARDHGQPADFLGDGVVAALDDHHLAFNLASRYWGGQVGNLEPAPGQVVWGVMFELDDAAAEAIRAKEGVRTGLSREITVEIRLVAGGDQSATLQLIEAQAFVAAHPGPAGPPSDRWLDSVIAGARAHALPASWIITLDGHRKGH